MLVKCWLGLANDGQVFTDGGSLSASVRALSIARQFRLVASNGCQLRLVLLMLTAIGWPRVTLATRWQVFNTAKQCWLALANVN